VGALVVFYSRTGTTSLVAEKVAALLGADTERIIVSGTKYEGAWGFIRGIFQSLTGGMPSINDSSFSPKNYDLIVVGGPIWAGHIAPPVRAYLRQYGQNFKSMAIFVTHGGSAPATALRQMEVISGRTALATLSVTAKQIADGGYDAAVRSFVETVEHARAGEVPKVVEIKPTAQAGKSQAT